VYFIIFILILFPQNVNKSQALCDRYIMLTPNLCYYRLIHSYPINQADKQYTKHNSITMNRKSPKFKYTIFLNNAFQ